MPDKNDWRIRNQEDYLMGDKLHKQDYAAPSPKWDHDHCEFCWATFSEHDGDLHEGYCALDKKRWICEQCFQDFKGMFNFTPPGKTPGAPPPRPCPRGPAR